MHPLFQLVYNIAPVLFVTRTLLFVVDTQQTSSQLCRSWTTYHPNHVLQKQRPVVIDVTNCPQVQLRVGNNLLDSLIKTLSSAKS
jgi:hypothetical protein